VARERDWFDYAGTLLLPVVIAIAGIIYTWQKDRADDARLALDRDSGYVKLLASTNDKERDLGLRIIDALSKEGKFSPDLVPVVSAVAAGRPGDPDTQKAAQILRSNPQAVARTDLPGPSADTKRVYIQIAREDQRAKARAFEPALSAAGFATQGIELVPNGTTNSYVRYFAKADKGPAEQVAALLDAQGIHMGVQDFATTGQAGSKPLEIWIGSALPPEAASAATSQ
jgi:hypothetical protein